MNCNLLPKTINCDSQAKRIQIMLKIIWILRIIDNLTLYGSFIRYLLDPIYYFPSDIDIHIGFFSLDIEKHNKIDKILETLSKQYFLQYDDCEVYIYFSNNLCTSVSITIDNIKIKMDLTCGELPFITDVNITNLCLPLKKLDNLPFNILSNVNFMKKSVREIYYTGFKTQILNDILKHKFFMYPKKCPTCENFSTKISKKDPVIEKRKLKLINNGFREYEKEYRCKCQKIKNNSSIITSSLSIEESKNINVSNIISQYSSKSEYKITLVTDLPKQKKNHRCHNKINVINSNINVSRNIVITKPNINVSRNIIIANSNLNESNNIRPKLKKQRCHNKIFLFLN